MRLNVAVDAGHLKGRSSARLRANGAVSPFRALNLKARGKNEGYEVSIAGGPVAAKDVAHKVEARRNGGDGTIAIYTHPPELPRKPSRSSVVVCIDATTLTVENGSVGEGFWRTFGVIRQTFKDTPAARIALSISFRGQSDPLAFIPDMKAFFSADTRPIFLRDLISLGLNINALLDSEMRHGVRLAKDLPKAPASDFLKSYGFDRGYECLFVS